MTSRERLLTALNGRRPDRVPVTLFIQSQGHFATQLAPDSDPWDFEATQKRIIDYQRSLGCDVHARMLFFNPHEPMFNFMGHLNTDVETPDWKISTEKTYNASNCTTNYRHTITTPEGQLNQVFSINESRPGIFMYGVPEPPIKTEEDLRIAMKYEPPVPEETRLKMKENVGVIRDYLGDDGIVSAWTNGSLFNNACALIDQTELFGLFLTEPEFYADLMTFCRKRVFDFTDAIIDAGVDALDLSGNAAGGFMGNRCFSQYILPWEKEYIDHCRERGTIVIYHNCGKVMELIESYKRMNITNVEPFSPHPLGDGDLDALHGMLNGEFSVTSGVNQVHVLQQGTLEDVRRATLDALEKGKKFNSFILQNVDFLEYGTPLENVEMFVRTGLENAAY